MNGDGKVLGKETVYRLICQAHEGSEEARDRLIRANTGLVKALALKFTVCGYELDDLMQVGFIGLIKAIDHFDPEFDVMFSTYAVPLILGELKRYLRDDGTIKINRQTKQDVKRMRALAEQFCQREGKSPRLSQLAELMGEPQERIVDLMEAQEAMYGIGSLDDPDLTAGRTMGEDREEQMVDHLSLRTAIASLPARERSVVLLRYYRDMTQQQIAERLGMSQVQVSRMEKRIMERLRIEMNENV